MFLRIAAVLAFALLQASGSPAMAHARWFVHDPQIKPAAFEFGRLHVTLAVLTIAFLLALFAFDRFSHWQARAWRVFNRNLSLPAGLEWRVVAAVFGAVLIINSMESVFLAPNLSGDKTFALKTLLFLQIVLGAMLVMQTRITETSISLLVLPLLGLASFTWQALIDYALEIAAVGVALYMVAPLVFERDRSFRRNLRRLLPDALALRMVQGGATRVWNLPLPSFPAEFRGEARARREAEAADWLRVMLGAQLVVLAAHDKLLNPGISLAFVDMYPFVNFPALLGFDFTNLDFVFAAGLAETAFGIALMFNLASRAVSLAMFALFTITGVLFGLSEMLGHLPIIAILAAIFVQGSGRPAVENPVATMIGAFRSRARFVAAAAVASSIAMVFTGDSTATARAAPFVVAPSSEAQAQPIAALAAPRVLFENFLAEVGPQDRLPAPVVEQIEAVKAEFAAAADGRGAVKDAVASKLFGLSMAYERFAGAHGAARWLRVAHLTSSCTPDEVLELRNALGSPRWLAQLSRMPDDLRRALLPVAQASASAILGHEIDVGDAEAWKTVSLKAAPNGPGFDYTHTLAAIGRIAIATATTAP